MDTRCSVWSFFLDDRLLAEPHVGQPGPSPQLMRESEQITAEKRIRGRIKKRTPISGNQTTRAPKTHTQSIYIW